MSSPSRLSLWEAARPASRPRSRSPRPGSRLPWSPGGSHGRQPHEVRAGRARSHALETLGVWQHCREQAAPLRDMRIVDGTARLCGRPRSASMRGRSASPPSVTISRTSIWSRRSQPAPASSPAHPDRGRRAMRSARGRTGHGHADGRRTGDGAACGRRRRSATPSAGSRPASTSACTPIRRPRSPSISRHGRPHRDTSTEFHTETGPFTLVPLPGLRSSLVFVVDPAEAPRLVALAGPDIAKEIEQRSHSILGKVAVERGAAPFR